MELNNLNVVSVLTLSALFQNPFDADSFVSYCPVVEVECLNILDKPFPLDLDLIELLIELSYKELVAEFNQNREDITNNSRDNGEK